MREQRAEVRGQKKDFFSARLRNFCLKMLMGLALFCFIPVTVTADEFNFLRLVNRENPLDKSYSPSDLVNCAWHGVQLRRPTCEAFSQMLKAMEAEGIRGLRLQSGFRSYAYQEAVLNQRVKELMTKGQSREEALEAAFRSIQPPGASEHQLGLALDVSVNGRLCQEFAQTPAGRWLEENCHKFGFIIRYPRDKTAVTNIVYEPWHLRYVGLPHSTAIKERGLTLEEYHIILRWACSTDRIST